MDVLYKKSIWLEWIRDKNHQADAARDDGAKRALVCLTLKASQHNKQQV
jgi:hypothetical protein